MSKQNFKARKAGKPIDKASKDPAFAEKTLAEVTKDKGFKSYKGKGLPIFKKGPNDSSWRTSNKLSTTLAASLPFFNPNGLKIEVTEEGSVNHVVVPGIMRVAVNVTVGNATDYNSPVNLAARRTYSRTRMRNSGSKNYEAIDQMVYFLSMEQAYSLCGWLQRLYRVVNKFSATDRFQPRSLVVSMEVNYDDIVKHQAELAWLIRWMGNALNSLAVPKMPIFTAAYDAFRHIYTDDSSPRKQIYLLDAYTFGVYNPVYDSNGGGIDYGGGTKADRWAGDDLLTYEDIYDMVHAIMDPILGDEDIGVIAGDIMKAYEESELFKVESDSMDVIDLEYSEELLQQIHNIRTLSPGFANLQGYKQMPGTVNTAPYLVADLNLATAPAAGIATPRKFDIDAFSDTPSPEEVVNCTALQARTKWKLNTSVNPATVSIQDCCFDLLVPRVVEVYLSPVDAHATYTLATEYSDVFLLGPMTAHVGLRRTMNFDWAPFTYGATVATGDGSIAPIGDVRMLGYFDYKVHQRIHENSVLNLFELLDN